jgi:hypothetical protein
MKPTVEGTNRETWFVCEGEEDQTAMLCCRYGGDAAGSPWVICSIQAQDVRIFIKTSSRLECEPLKLLNAQPSEEHALFLAQQLLKAATNMSGVTASSCARIVCLVPFPSFAFTAVFEALHCSTCVSKFRGFRKIVVRLWTVVCTPLAALQIPCTASQR